MGTGGRAPASTSANGSVSLYNTIVNLDQVSGRTTSTGTIGGFFNLIGSTGPGGLVNGVNGNLIGVTNPGLAPALANNGGPTQTIALVAGSPAIDAGANLIGGVTIPTTDERGAVRGNAGGLNAGSTVDIGAYNASSEYLVTTASDSNDLSTLRTGVGWANVSTNANPANINPTSTTFDAPNTVEFSSPQTITLSPALGTLVLTDTVTPVAIQGPASGTVTISGGGAVGVLQVDAGVTATMAGLAITGGSSATGAGINNAGKLTVSGTTVSGNSASGSGGGINNAPGGTLNLSTTIVSGNSATGSGGGISNAGTLNLTGITVEDNSAAASGGGISDPGTLTVVGTTAAPSTIMGNSAGKGGGIAAGGTLNLTGVTITENTASAAGGGIAVLGAGTANLTGLTVTGNSAGTGTVAGSGGGLDNAGTLTLGYSTIAGNTFDRPGRRPRERVERQPLDVVFELHE